MEDELRGRTFVLRETTPIKALDGLVKLREWDVKIEQDLKAITINGDPSEEIFVNSTLRTLVWTNLTATEDNVASGILEFDREFLGCHGTVKLGADLVFNVSNSSVEVDDSKEENPVLSILGLSPSDLLDPPPPYSALDEPQFQSYEQKVEISPPVTEIPLEYEEKAADGLAASEEDQVSYGAAAAAAPEGAFAAAEEVKEEEEEEATGYEDETGDTTSQVTLLTYSTKRKEPDEGDDAFEDFPPIGVGTALKHVAHPVIMFNNNVEITQFVVIDGEKMTKKVGEAKDACPWGFEITFEGMGESRKFSGKLVKPGGREYNWQGNYSTLTTITRQGTNQRTKGSDGLALDPLLSAMTNLSRELTIDEKTQQAKATDMAQEAADRIFGRLIFASVDKDVSDLLFPGKFVLSEAEKKIQLLGPDFLKRAAMHTILANLSNSENVKPSIKNKINSDKCQRFIPMCVAGPLPPNTANDPVKEYGFDRIKDKTVVEKLQKEAKDVSQACYQLGYKTTVVSFQPYLANAGEWYSILQKTLSSDVFLQDWKNKASGSGGYAKALFDIHTKLDLLHEEAKDSEILKAKLPKVVKLPTEIISELNAAGMDAQLDNILFDDTAREGVRKFFRNLDEIKDEREKQLAHNLRRQLIVDGSQSQSFLSLSDGILSLMDELCKGEQRSIKEIEQGLALLDGAEAHAGLVAEAAGQAADTPAWHKGFKWKPGCLSVFRSVLTVVGFGTMMVIYTQNATGMDPPEQLAMVGQMTEGFLAVRGTMAKLAKGASNKVVMPVGQFLYRWVLAPIGKICKTFGVWLYKSLHRVGKSIIQGIGQLVVKIQQLVAKGVEKVMTKVGSAGTWLKSVSIRYGPAFNCLANVASFGVSAVCFWVSVRDCKKAWESGRTLDIVTSTISAALAGLEVLCLVIQGIAYLAGATKIVAICSFAGPILAVAGIVFAFVMIGLAIAFQEDPLDDMVKKYGNEYGILK